MIGRFARRHRTSAVPIAVCIRVWNRFRRTAADAAATGELNELRRKIEREKGIDVDDGGSVPIHP